MARRHPVFSVVIRGAFISEAKTGDAMTMKRNAAGLGDQELWYELPASWGNVGREQVIAHVPNCGNAQQCSSLVCLA